MAFSSDLFALTNPTQLFLRNFVDLQAVGCRKINSKNLVFLPALKFNSVLEMKEYLVF
jgi:hypothetical protein